MIVLKLVGFIILSVSYFSDIAYGLKCYECRDCQNLDPVRTQTTDCKASCYTATDNDYKWFRGCSSDSINGYLDVLQCSEELCNSNNNNFLACYTCKGHKCNTDIFQKPPTPCRLSETTCYQKYDENSKFLERGCSEQLSECDASNCKTCNHDGCNIDTLHKCHFCDPSEDSDCEIDENLRTCTTFGECYSCLSNDKKLSLGCQADEGKTCISCPFKNCNTGKLKKCIKCLESEGTNCSREKCSQEISIECRTENCNIIKPRADEKKCAICNGDKEQSCNNEISADDFKTCGDGKTDCFAYVSEKKNMVRGCQSKDNPDDVCDAQGDKCIVAASNGFSLYKEFSCYKCERNNELCPYEQANETSINECKFLFNEDANCFTFIAESNVVTRGCSNAVDACPEENEKCLLCPDSICNSGTQASQICIQCQDTDPNCVIAANIKGTECKNQPTHYNRGCYAKITDNGVERGCLSSLNDGEVDFCFTETRLCAPCHGDDCNTNVMSPLICYNCSYPDTLSCLYANNLNDTQTCESVSDVCITAIYGSDTVRGCKAQTQHNSTAESLECSEDFCNTHIFEKDWAQCYTCGTNGGNTEACNKEQGDSTLRKCPNKNDLCYAYVNAKGGMVRGCISDQNSNNCRDDNCLKFDYPRGNNMPLETTLNCSKCELSDVSCLWFQPNVTQCTFLFNEDPFCYVMKLDAESMARGCGNEKDACSEESDDCEICRMDNCNQKSEIDQNCISCAGNETSACLLNPQSLKAKSCPDVEYSKRGCFTQRNEFGVERGCLSDHLPEIIDKCVSKNDLGCTWCEGDSCNTDLLENLECYNCSSADNLNCLRLRNRGATKKCDNVFDMCVTGFSLQNTTIRGCKAEVNTKPEETFACLADKCNEVVLARDIAECYSCGNDNSVDPNCDELPTTATPTPCTDIRDGCFAYLNQANGMVRGCTSDTDVCKPENCRTSDLAGSNSYSLRHRLVCATCGKDEPSCPWFQRLEDHAPACEFLFPQVPQCFTQLQDEKIMARGCTNDAGACTTADNNCQLCDTRNCNNAMVIQQSCIQCLSNNTATATCSETAEGITSSVCNITDIEYENRGCFARRDDNDVVVRGCAASLSPDDLSVCKDRTKKCHYCETDGCNNEKAPGGSNSYHNALSTITIGLIATFISILN